MKDKFKRLLLLTALALLTTSLLRAQSIAPQSVNSAGIKVEEGSGSLSFTVGELVVLTLIDSNGNTLGGGFTTGSTTSTITASNILEPDITLLDVEIFPNPTNGLLTIFIPNMKIRQLVLEVFDIAGKTVLRKEYEGTTNDIVINMAPWINGTYLINLKNHNGQVLGSYKIIKQ